MLEGIDVNQRVEFVSSKDNSEPKTIFVLKPLSGSEMLRVADSSGNYGSLINLLLASVVEIKNFSTDNIEEAINMLPSDILNEILTKINSINHISEQDAKN